MKRFLGLTQEEISENEKLWGEENGNNLTKPVEATGGLRGVGVSQSAVSSELDTQTAEAPAGMDAPPADMGGAPDAGGGDMSAPA